VLIKKRKDILIMKTILLFILFMICSIPVFAFQPPPPHNLGQNEQLWKGQERVRAEQKHQERLQQERKRREEERLHQEQENPEGDRLERERNHNQSNDNDQFTK
jgi:biopolymer transport protein ExbB/TolQ